MYSYHLKQLIDLPWWLFEGCAHMVGRYFMGHYLHCKNGHVHWKLFIFRSNKKRLLDRNY